MIVECGKLKLNVYRMNFHDLLKSFVRFTIQLNTFKFGLYSS